MKQLKNYLYLGIVYLLVGIVFLVIELNFETKSEGMLYFLDLLASLWRAIIIQIFLLV